MATCISQSCTEYGGWNYIEPVQLAFNAPWLQLNTPFSPLHLPLASRERKKALLIGIDYFGQRGQLRGCVESARNMASYLTEGFDYASEDIVILAEDMQAPGSQPTKLNILRAMHWLVKDARPGDYLLLRYSG